MLMDICQILLLQRSFDMYSVLNEKIILYCLIYPRTLIGPTSSL